MARLEGKVALITGAARGQGRSHALRLAEDGADIIALDICKDVASVPYPLAKPEDLKETARLVEQLDRRISIHQVDVRDATAMKAAIEAGVADIGPVDIVLANAGILPVSMPPTAGEWHDVIDINLTGVYQTVEAVVPAMIERGAGGVIVLTSSTAGLTGVGGNSPGGLGYTAAKHGVVGLMRAYANYLAPHRIRVNSVHPTGVSTMMVENEAVQAYLNSDLQPSKVSSNALPVEVIEARDVSNAIAWLVSEDARYVTGVTLPVDAGFVNQK